MKFTKFLRTSVSTEHLPWMLLYLYLTAYYLFLNDPKIISKSKALGILLQLIYYLTNSMRYWRLIIMMLVTAWKVSEDGVFSGPYFPTSGLNTERYSVTLRIQSECGKTRTRKTSVFAHFSRSGWIIFFVKWLAVKSMVNSLCQPHKIVKRTQAICRLLPTNCLSEFNHFVGMALKDLRSISCETSVTHYSKPLIRHDEFFIVIFLF